MSIVLDILKWIGIGIGGIAGLLFLLVGIVLLIPIRYYVEVKKDENHFSYGFSIRWLFCLVIVKKRMDSDKFFFRIFGIPIRGKDKRPEKKGKKEKAVREEMPDKSEENEKMNKPVLKEIPADGKKKNVADKKKKARHKKHFSFETLSSIIKEVRDSGNRRAVKAVLGELCGLLRYLSPKKVRLSAVAGTGDPCNTGLLFGGMSMIPWFYAEGVHIVPDFEEKILHLDGYGKGRIRVIYFIRLVLRLYRNRDLKRFYHHIMKKEAA